MKLPPKEVESKPCDTLCVEFLGQYQFDPTDLQAATMKDLVTCWLEICTMPSAQVDLIANQVELAWLTRYPLPIKVILDQRNRFLAEFGNLIQVNNGIKVKPITSRNQQANSILQKGHRTIESIICTFKV